MISVIIPTWEEEKYIEKTLKSLKNQDYDKRFEIIIVDAGSRDRTREIARKYTKKVYTIGRGVPKARQFGTKKAKGDIVAFTDADTVYCKNWLKQIEKSFEDPEVVGVAGKILAYKNSAIKYRFYYWLVFYQFLVMSHYIFGKKIFVGSNCAARRDKILEIGGFDTGFKSGDDHDVGYRLGLIGKVILNPNLVVRVSPRKEEKMGCIRMMLHHSKNYIKRYILGQRKYTGPYVKII